MIYTKYSASGNDFIIFHTFVKKDYSKKAKKLCNRTQSIGADGLIVLLPHEKYDFQWLFYNSDGSEASMCGNGTRACAHYAYKNALAPKDMKFMTGSGLIKASVRKDIVKTQLPKAVCIKEEFKQFGFTWYLVNTGVPHLVTIVDNLKQYDKKVSFEMRHKYNANVNFAKIENNKMYVRTYERGVEGETLACGTGMAACFFKGNNVGLLGNKIKVYPKSNEELTLSKKNGILHFKGAVKKLFTTSIS